MAGMSATVVTLDDKELQAFLALWDPSDVDRVLWQAAKAGGNAAAPVVRNAAPVGLSKREGQYYRRQGLRPGTFRATIRSAIIRVPGVIGYVIGPMGKNAFTRYWVAGGVKPHIIPVPKINPTRFIHHPGHTPDHWFPWAAAEAAAKQGSDAVLNAYGRRTR
jgi:hypothetical protein